MKKNILLTVLLALLIAGGGYLYLTFTRTDSGTGSVSDPEFCASDLLAQAEHDTRARPILVRTAIKVADEIEAAPERQLAEFPKRSAFSATSP